MKRQGRQGTLGPGGEGNRGFQTLGKLRWVKAFQERDQHEQRHGVER